LSDDRDLLKAQQNNKTTLLSFWKIVTFNVKTEEQLEYSIKTHEESIEMYT
jgi:hypothetical protein